MTDVPRQAVAEKLTELQVLNAIHGKMLGRAEALDRMAFWLQSAAIGINILGLLLGLKYPTVLPLAAGIISVILLVVWLATYRRHLVFRSAGEKARRCHLLADSFGVALSPTDLGQLLQRADADAAALRRYLQNDYYPPSGPVGAARLSLATWESAFFSEALNKKAAESYRRWFWFVLIVFMFALVVTLRFTPQSDSNPMLDSVATILLTGGSFAVLAELFLRSELHAHAAADLAPIQIHLDQLYRRAFVTPVDLLMVLGDYNSTVEAAPMIPKRIYEANRDRLNEQWKIIVAGLPER